jgi:serine/threonine-protein kinase PknK
VVRRKDPAAPTEIPAGYRDAVEIGSGAFATVYRAIEIDTNRPVALKILKIDAVHPPLIEAFARETQALAMVSDHPNIVTLYRPLSTPDGRPVLVLELCRESLAQQVRRDGPLPARTVTTVGIKISGALETAHRHLFLHRDMKPQNILATQFDEPALGGFGVAALQASARATAGVFGFTTLHAAPEMLEGHHLSAATDVYGLASTMYQLLTGSAPFAAFDNEAPASVILRIIRDPVRPLRAEDIPIGLSDLLEAGLSKDPGQRPGSAVEFADGLVAVEAAAGWPPTSYVAWGQGSRVSPSDPAAPPAGAASPISPALALPPRSAPRSEPPPLLPPANPSLRPLRLGPSVAVPEEAPRHVLRPDRDDRRPDHLVEPTYASRPQQTDQSDAASARSARPVFVDPPVAYPPAPGVTMPPVPELVYEQTILPPLGESSRPAHEGAAPARGQPLTGSPLLVAGLVIAAVVIVAALLLAFGVL